jgi:hypothetical protein
MKKVLILAMALTMCASMAFAQGGVIGCYTDLGLTSCEYTGAPGGVVLVYVGHTLAPLGATASQFKVDDSAITDLKFGFTVSAGLLSLGTYNTGIAISYAGCLPTPLILGTIQYFDQGLTAACALILVVPDPAVVSGNIEVVDCAVVPTKLQGISADMVWDGTQTGCASVCVVGTQETSWGGIKSLYY